MAPQNVYQPQDAVQQGIRCGAIGAGSGLFMAAARNSLSHERLGVMTVFTRTGHLVGFPGVALGALGFTRAASANLREKDDPWNAAISGAVGGAIAGLSRRTMPAVLGCGAGLALVLSVFEYTGGRFDGYFNRREEDAFEIRERMMKNRRKSLEETLAEVGEGRGIRPPGYEERRRERIKEKYGFEIDPVKATVD
ncbi:hypothetical protein VUR80DRAFT_4515 [Thermomyces stellatus]